MQLLVERQIERTNRNILVTGVLLLALLGGLAAVTAGYYANYFGGPFPTTLAEVAQARDQVPAHAWVRLQGELIQTEYQHVTIQTDKRTNEEKSRKVTAEYLVLMEEGRTLLIKAPVGTRGQEISGWLHEPEKVDRDVLAGIRSEHAEVADSLLPLVLDATADRTGGTLGLVAGAALLVLALLQLQRWSGRRARPASHPIWKRLARLGEARSLAAQLDMEVRASDVVRFQGRTTLTRSWIVRERLYGYDLLPLDRLAWIHKKVTAQKQYFITVGKQYEAIVCDRDGGQLSFRAKEAEVDRLLTALAERVPWVLVGWTQELERAWTKQRAEVIAAVDARREEQRRAAAGGSGS
jgi:hypothetical protein